MKRIVYLFLAMGIFFLNACNKEDSADGGNSATIKKNFPVALNISFNLAIMAREAYVEGNCQLFNCENVINVESINNRPKVIHFNFGEGCKGIDQVLRKGIIIDSITDIGGSAGEMHKLFFFNYEEDGVKVEGAEGNFDNMFSSVQFNSSFQISNAKYYTKTADGGFSMQAPSLYITPKNEGSLFFQCVGYFKLTNLNETGYQDDAYSFDGKSIGVWQNMVIHSPTFIEVLKDGQDQFAFAIITSPQFSFQCGSKKIKGGTFDFVRTVDPGSAFPEIYTTPFELDPNQCN